jgi:hypothetical protein
MESPSNPSRLSTLIADQENSALESFVADHPVTSALLEDLIDPNLSKEDFFAKIDAFNDAATGGPEDAAGTYTSASASIDGGRHITLKHYASTGRLTVSGSAA